MASRPASPLGWYLASSASIDRANADRASNGHGLDQVRQRAEMAVRRIRGDADASRGLAQHDRRRAAFSGELGTRLHQGAVQVAVVVGLVLTRVGCRHETQC